MDNSSSTSNKGEGKATKVDDGIAATHQGQENVRPHELTEQEMAENIAGHRKSANRTSNSASPLHTGSTSSLTNANNSSSASFESMGSVDSENDVPTRAGSSLDHVDIIELVNEKRKSLSGGHTGTLGTPSSSFDSPPPYEALTSASPSSSYRPLFTKTDWKREDMKHKEPTNPSNNSSDSAQPLGLEKRKESQHPSLLQILVTASEFPDLLDPPRRRISFSDAYNQSRRRNSGYQSSTSTRRLSVFEMRERIDPQDIDRAEEIEQRRRENHHYRAPSQHRVEEPTDKIDEIGPPSNWWFGCRDLFYKPLDSKMPRALQLRRLAHFGDSTEELQLGKAADVFRQERQRNESSLQRIMRTQRDGGPLSRLPKLRNSAAELASYYADEFEDETDVYDEDDHSAGTEILESVTEVEAESDEKEDSGVQEGTEEQDDSDEEPPIPKTRIWKGKGRDYDPSTNF